MSLSSAISTAQSILSNTSTQTSIVSRNIANAGNADYVRRSATLATSMWGAQVANISRASNDVLFRENIAGIASASGQNALLDGLDRIKSILGGNDFETAPSTLIGNFRDTLQLFASKPSDPSAAQAAVSDAQTVADGIRDASTAVQKLRKETDAEIGRTVTELNKLLGDFEKANNDVKRATQAGGDASDALDERDRLLRSISGIVGVTTVVRTDNDMSLYTTGGTTLFETVPRPVTFEPKNGYDATIAGNPVYIDGVSVMAGMGGATTASGSLAGLLQVRDDIAPAFQMQLDETARGLVSAMPEVFVYSTVATPGDPTAGLLMPGISQSLQVNAAIIADPRQLRDGLGGAANPTGASGFSALLESYIVALDTPMAFDGAAQAGVQGSVISYAADSVGWLEFVRQQANFSAETKNASYFRTTEALSNATGVNLDEEMSRLLELEQSYKASARLIAAVDEMLRTLMDSVR